MRAQTFLIVSPWILLAALAAGCGTEIGDSCTVSSDCSPTGDRICQRGADLPQGYCTIMGCDHDTCPEESICVRFFAVATTGKACDPATEETTPSCDPAEFCTLSGSCVPRTAEIRFCMRTCGNNGDCRDAYECRDRALMIEHGGEPVLAPGADRLGTSTKSFCAAAPSTSGS